jgi:hypothetical protein
LYRSGDKKTAEELGAVVAKQLESIINYFEKSDAYFAGNPENHSDLLSALDSYFKLHMSAIDPVTGNASGALAKRTQTKIDNLYKKSFPEMLKKLDEKATSNGESTRRGSNAGKYARMKFELEDYIQAIGVHYQYLAPPAGAPKPAPEMNGMSIEQMMQQMPVGDSVIK